MREPDFTTPLHYPVKPGTLVRNVNRLRISIEKESMCLNELVRQSRLSVQVQKSLMDYLLESSSMSFSLTGMSMN